jgi:hypothetical protein
MIILKPFLFIAAGVVVLAPEVAIGYLVAHPLFGVTI